MSVSKPLFGASVALATTNLDTLGNSSTAGWQSASVDNASELAIGVLIYISVTLASGGPASDKSVYVYVYESEDGTNFTDNATGSEGALTRRDPTNFKLLGTIACPASGSLTYKQVFMYAPPVMPRKWGLYINNFTGLAFTASDVSYTPVQVQNV